MPWNSSGGTPQLQVAAGHSHYKHKVQGAKVRSSMSASKSEIQKQQASPTSNTDLLRISMGAVGVHDAAIIAT